MQTERLYKSVFSCPVSAWIDWIQCIRLLTLIDWLIDWLTDWRERIRFVFVLPWAKLFLDALGGFSAWPPCPFPPPFRAVAWLSAATWAGFNTTCPTFWSNATVGRLSFLFGGRIGEVGSDCTEALCGIPIWPLLAKPVGGRDGGAGRCCCWIKPASDPFRCWCWNPPLGKPLGGGGGAGGPFRWAVVVGCWPLTGAGREGMLNWGTGGMGILPLIGGGGGGGGGPARTRSSPFLRKLGGRPGTGGGVGGLGSCKG